MAQRRRSNRPTTQTQHTGEVITNLRLHNELKVNICAKELVGGMHGGKVQVAMRHHGIDRTVDKRRVTRAIKVHEKHAAALRAQLLPPLPAAAAAALGTPATSPSSTDGADAGPAPSAPATPAAAGQTSAAHMPPQSATPATPAGRARLAEFEFRTFYLEEDDKLADKRIKIAALFDECSSKTEVTSLAGRLLAAGIRGCKAYIIAAAVRTHCPVRETKNLQHKTVTASRDRYLAGTEPARGRQPALGVGFDELLKKWVILQRLHFKVPVTKASAGSTRPRRRSTGSRRRR
jgi:hypothetical protein